MSEKWLSGGMIPGTKQHFIDTARDMDTNLSIHP
jgi:hypothetical protein